MKYPIEVHINGELVFINSLDSAELTSVINELEAKYENKAYGV